MLGAAALAQFTIRTYAAPIVLALRNSISDAVLPEPANAGANDRESTLRLWQRTIVVFTILLVPITVLLVMLANPVVVTMFSREYLEAAPLFQVSALVLLRECFDFGVLNPGTEQKQFAGDRQRRRSGGQPRAASAIDAGLWPDGSSGDHEVLRRCVSDAADRDPCNVPLRTMMPWGTLGRVLVISWVPAVIPLAPRLITQGSRSAAGVQCGGACLCRVCGVAPVQERPTRSSPRRYTDSWLGGSEPLIVRRLAMLVGGS